MNNTTAGQQRSDSLYREIVFIVGDLADVDSLVQGVRAGVDIVRLDPAKDALAAMAEVLQGRSGLAAVHLVSHGSAGALQLGTLTLTAAELEERAGDLASIGAALAADGDLLLYGCDVAAGAAGALFLRDLAAAAGADAAASVDLTGSAALGGDWVLEHIVGDIRTPGVLTPEGMAAYAGVLAGAGTVDFNTGDATTLGTTVTDGMGGSSNIAGIEYQIYSTTIGGAPSGTPWTYYLDTNIGQDGLIPEGSGEPVIVIRSADGSNFAFKGISIGDYFGFQNQVKFEGFKDGASTGSVTLNINRINFHEVFTASSFPAVNFQSVDTIHITNPNDFNDGITNAGKVNFVSVDELVFDEASPAVTSVSASTANGTYKTGDTISISVTFDSSMTVTGFPTLALNAGGSAVFGSGSGSSTLTFNYTVLAGHSAADLDYSATNALALAGGTITSGGINATLTLPAVGGASSLGGQKNIVVDGVAPGTASIVRANATPTTAASVDYTVTFSESVTGVDTADFQLTSTGSAAAAIASVSGSGSSYTVTVNSITGDGTLRLDLKNAGTGIADGAGNAIGAGYTAGQLYTIDNTAPAVSTVTSSTANGTYKTGDVIAVTVNFSESVTVTGAPVLALNSGSSAVYASGSGTSSLTFNYTVAGGDNSADLDYSAVNSLTLSGGSIADAVGNSAVLTLPAVGGASSLGGQKNLIVDGVIPSSTSATVPASATYAAGQALDFGVSFNEAVTVDTGGGTPRIAVTLGTGGTVYASYISGSGTSVLTFRHIVGAGTQDSDGIAVATAIALNGGTIRDTAGNNATLTGIAFGATGAVLVDGVAPTITSINRTGSAQTNSTTLNYAVTFAEAVSGLDSADFALTTIGTASGTVSAVSGSGTSYTVTVNAISGDGIMRLDLKSSGTGVQDGAGNPIAAGYTSGQTYTIDQTAPAVTSVGVPANATYGLGQNLDFTVNFSDAITVNTGGGTPRIAITLDTGGTVHAEYLSGSGSTALTFRYAVAAGNSDPNGIAVGSAIAANGGSLRDTAGNDATLTLNSVGSTAAVLVNAVVPVIAAVSVPANGTYVAGQQLDFIVTFDDSVTVNTGGGTPSLGLTLDTGGAVQAAYVSGSGSTALTFRYTVASGNADGNGVVLAGALALNGGSIANSGGNNAALILNNVASAAAVLVDALAPAVTSVSVPANGVYKAGEALEFTVQFDEAVIIDSAGGTPRIALLVGATTRYADYVSGSGSTGLVFRYTITSGEVDANGITVGSLSANGGTLRDAAGNNASTTLTAVGATANVRVDAVAPILNSATFSVAENAANTTAVGSATASDATALAYMLTDDAGGRFAIDAGSGQISVANGTLLDFEAAASHSVSVRATDAAGNQTTTAFTVNLTNVNEAPAIANLGGDSATYVKAAAPILIDRNAGAAVSDPEGGPLTGGSLSVAIAAGGAIAQDVLAIRSQGTGAGQIGVAGGTVSYGGTPIGTWTGGSGGAPLAVALNASASLAAVSALLQNITYANSDTLTPTFGDRTVRFVLADGAGGTSASYDAIVQVQNNIAPVLAVNAGALLEAGAAPVLTAGMLQVTDVDNTAAQLSYTLQVVPAKGSLKLDGATLGAGATFTQADIDAARVRYASNGTAGSDSFAFTVSDGNGGSIAQTSFNLAIDPSAAPVVASVNVPAGGTYGIGQTLDFTVNFNEAVTVDLAGGRPYIALALDIGAGQAFYVSGSGTGALTFRYQVPKGAADFDGIVRGAAIALDGATIRDAAGNNALLALNGAGSTATVLIDGQLPEARSIAPAGPTPTNAAAVSFTVAFNEAVSGVDAADFVLSTSGAASGSIVSVSGSGASYTVSVNSAGGDGTLRLDLKASGTGIVDAAGNPVAGGFSAGQAYTIDRTGAAPATVQLPAAGVYKAGDALDFTVVASEAVFVDTSGGLPRIALALDTGGTVHATYLSGSGSASLVFRYIVASGNVDTNGVTVGALSANGATLRDGAGNSVTLALASTGSTDSIRIDAVAPVLNGATFSVAENAANGTAVGSASASDATALTYALTDSAGGRFAIDAGSGQISVANGALLDIETAAAHSVTVRATDAAGNQSSAPFTINLAIDSAPVTGTVDGVPVVTQTGRNPDGSVTRTIVVPTVQPARVDTVGGNTAADIALVGSGATALLTAQVPAGFGLQLSGSIAPGSGTASLAELLRAIEARTGGAPGQAALGEGASGFLAGLPAGTQVLAQTIVPTAGSGTAAEPLVIRGPAPAQEAPQMALVIDARGLPPTTTIQLDNVDFAAVIGAARLVGGAGAQTVWGDDAAQYIFLGAGDDVLHGGGGNDTVGSGAGNDRIFGDGGNDLLFGGEGNDFIDGGSGTDTLQLSGRGRADYTLRVQDGHVVFTHRAGGADGSDIVAGTEIIRFTGTPGELDFNRSDVATLVRLYGSLLGRRPDEGGINHWLQNSESGMPLQNIAQALVESAEAQVRLGAMNNQQYVDMLYRSVLARSGSANELAYWTDRLDSGAIQRGGVLLGFADSAERIGLVGVIDTSIETM